MADQNLLDNDDFFAKEIPEKEKPKDKKEEVYSEEDDMFKPKKLDEQSAEELAYIESSLQERSDVESQPSAESNDFSDTIKDDFQEPQLKEPAAQEAHPPIADQTATPQSNDISYKQVYFDMDEQQEKVSFKPFLITLLIIIIVGVGGYFAYTRYLNDKLPAIIENIFGGAQDTEEVISELPIDSEGQESVNDRPPPPPEISPEERQKLNYISKVSSQTSQDIASFGDIIAASGSSAKLSSIVLYGSDLIVEVFGNSQSDLTRMNSELKKSSTIQNIKSISSSRRNNGIIGVYSAQLKSVDTGNQEVAASLTNNNEVNSWLRNIFSNNKLSVKNYKDRATKTQDNFRVHEVETVANGSINACLNAMNEIAAAGSNVRLYKLSCSAIDQQNFGASNYQLKLILKIYV
jgi:hypothetical protein